MLWRSFRFPKLPPQLKSLNMTHTAADTIITIRLLNGVTRAIMMFVSIAAGLVWKERLSYWRSLLTISRMHKRCRAALRAALRAHARFAPLFYHKRCCAALRAALRAHARCAPLFYHKRCRAALRAALRAHACYKIKNRLRNSQASLQFLSLFSILHRLLRTRLF